MLPDWIALKTLCGRACADPTVVASYEPTNARAGKANVYRFHLKTDPDATRDVLLFTDGAGGLTKLGADSKPVDIDRKAQASDLLASYATIVSFDAAAVVGGR